jgi:hypothetical protein
MRKAAGILLIIFGVGAIGLCIASVSGLVSYYTEYSQTPPDYLYIVTGTLAVFFIIGC